MPHFRTRLPLMLVGALALLGFTACAPTTTASVAPTETAVSTTAPTATLALAPAPTPTNVPAGWSVLDTPHFSLAYPQGWTQSVYPQQDGSTLYQITPTNPQQPALAVIVQERTSNGGSSCASGGGFQQVTLAGIPMGYGISGEGQLDRSWSFVNAQGTAFALSAGDAQSGSAIQAQDDTILATFRPDNATPWKC